jgi:hypothetical protein
MKKKKKTQRKPPATPMNVSVVARKKMRRPPRHDFVGHTP